MPTLVRGPLPPSVYWRRRVVVLTVVVVLVVAIAQLLGGGSDADSGEQAAAVVGSDERETVTVGPSGEPSASPGASGSGTAPGPSSRGSASPAEPSTTALPTPTGECPAADVVVEPAVEAAAAFSPVAVQLRVRTEETPACTWELSADSVQIRMTRGNRRLWSSVECPEGVPTTSLTVYRDTVSVVPMTWNAKRSDADLCGQHAAWAPVGAYAIAAASLGGEPSQSRFRLYRPGQVPAGEPEAGEEPDEPTGSASATGGASPSTGATPDGTASAPTAGPRPGARDEPGALPTAG